MSRINLIITILISSCVLNAQENKLKELTLDDAVLGYYKGLYPSSMRGLTWTNNNLLAIKNSNNQIEFFKPRWTLRSLSILSYSLLFLSYPPHSFAVLARDFK